MIMKQQDSWPDKGSSVFSQTWNTYIGDDGNEYGRSSHIAIHYLSEACNMNGESITAPWPDGIELYDMDGNYGGESIWEHFVITHEAYEDSHGGYHGTLEPIPTP